MTLPRLMRHGSEQEQRLLRAARCDGPNARLREQVLLSMGVGALLATESVPTMAAIGRGVYSGVKPSTGLCIAGGGTMPTGVVILVKWVAIAGLALLAGTGAGLAASSAWAERSIPDAAAVQRVAASRPPEWAPATPLLPMVLAPPKDPIAPTAATLPLPPPRVPAATLQRPAQEPNEVAVSQEVRLIDAARVALRMGDVTSCLRLLRARERRFASGVLNPEAALLRIEALSLSGQHEATKEAGLRFIAQHRAGPLSERVRSLLERQAVDDASIQATGAPAR
jgi:hypothetical protein